MFFFFSGSGAASDPRLLPLSAIIPSAVFDVDATLEASFDGTGQLWKNLIPAPADGSAQTAYDFWRGSTSASQTNDPTFNGTAGDPAAYFSNDGGDAFWLAGALTTFLGRLHRDQDFTFVTAMQTAPSGSPLRSTLFHTGLAPNTGQGIELQGNFSSNDIAVLMAGTSGYGHNTLTITNPSFSANCMIIMSHKHSTNKTKYWFNTATGTERNHTFAAANADAAATRVWLGGGGYATAGTRLYNASMFNEYFDDAKALAVIEQLEIRHGRNYI